MIPTTKDMERTVTRLGGAGLVFAAVTMTGCSNAAQGTFSGAALGAGAGAVIGSMFGAAGKGAAIGAVGGALSGGVIGDQNERRAHEAHYGYPARQSHHHHYYYGHHHHRHYPRYRCDPYWNW